MTLADLVQKGTVAEVGAAIKAGADVNTKDESGVTPLMRAVYGTSNAAVVSELLKAGADANAKDNGGWTPLIYAARSSQPELVTMLLRAGADGILTDQSGRAAFDYAKNSKNLAGTKQLQELSIRQGIFDLAANGTPEQLWAAMKAGADVNARKTEDAPPWRKDVTVLMEAAQYTQNPEVISVLLAAGADGRPKDSTGRTACSYAKDNQKLVKTPPYRELAYAQFGVASEIRAFFDLASGGTPERVRTAIKGGADAKGDDGFGFAPLMYAAWNNPDAGVIAVFLEAGVDVDTRAADGSTPLMGAARFNANPDVTAALLKAGAAVETTSRDGVTPLMYCAAENANPAVAAVLLTAGADVNAADRNGLTALMHAAGTNANPDMVTTLLKAGAQVNATDKDGFSALMDAAGSNANPDVITALLKAGADAKRRTANGRTAWDLAKDNVALKGTGQLRELEAASK